MQNIICANQLELMQMIDTKELETRKYCIMAFAQYLSASFYIILNL